MEKTAVNFSYAITVNTAPVSVYAVQADGTRTLLSTFTTPGQHTFLAQTPHTAIEGDYSLLTGPLTTAAVIGGGGSAFSTPGSGTPGQDGKDGLSAYELAVQQGYTGGLDEWLASLKGDPGPQGAPGAPGAPGQDGTSPAAEDVAAALLPMLSSKMTYEGPAGTYNWHANYFMLGEAYLPQDAALVELGYRVRFDSMNGCTTDPVYLGVWERTETGDDWELRGVSLNTQVQAQSTDMMWQFDPSKVRLSGRPIRCCLMETPEDGWRTDLTMGMRTADVGAANTAIFLGEQTWAKAPKFFMTAYKPVDLSSGSYAPASHVSDTTAHLTADEHSKLTTLLQNGGNSGGGNSGDGNHYGSGTNGSSVQIGEGAQASEIDTVALGYNATASGGNSTAIGARAIANETCATALGYEASAHGGNSIAIGAPARASQRGIAIGYCANSTGGLALGNYAEAGGHEIMLKETGSPGEGQGLVVKFVCHDTDAAELQLGGKGGVIIHDNEQQYKFTFAALAAAANSTGNSSGDGDHAGVDTFSVLVGPETEAGNQGTAVGFRAIAKGFGFAFGCAAKAEEGEGVLSVGAVPDYDNRPNQIEGTILKILDPYSEASRQKLGGEAGLAYSVRGSEYRYIKLSALFNMVEAGGSSPGNSSSGNSSSGGSIGSDITDGWGAGYATNEVRFGVGSISGGMQASAFGAHASVDGDYSAALGGESQVKANTSTALGSHALVKGNGSTAIGQGAVTADDGVCVIATNDTGRANFPENASDGFHFKDLGQTPIRHLFTQFFFIGAGCPLSTKYLAGAPGLGYIVYDVYQRKITQRGVLPFTSLNFTHTTDFAPALH